MKFWHNNWYLTLLSLAVLLRILIMPFFFHPDIKTYSYQVSFLQKGVWNIYSYIPDHKAQLPLKEEFVYFPLTYFTLGFYQILVGPFLGSEFYSWLSNANSSAVETTGIFFYLFILKLPYLILDCLTAFFLIKLVKEEESKRRIFLFWLFNPFSMIILYIFSNVDIFPVFLTVLSLFFVKKNNWYLAALMLGLGAGFKAYPLLLVPFLFFSAPRVKDKIVVLISSTVPLALVLTPFIKTPGFQNSTLDSGLTTRIISSGFSIGFGEMLYPGLILLAAIYFFAWQRKIHLNNLPSLSFSVILAIFISIHFHIQWLLWPIPFAVLILANQTRWAKGLIILMILGLLIPFIYDDSAMSVATLSVINPLFESLPTPFKVIQHFYNPLIIQSILHSLFFGAGLLTITHLYRQESL